MCLHARTHAHTVPTSPPHASALSLFLSTENTRHLHALLLDVHDHVLEQVKRPGGAPEDGASWRAYLAERPMWHLIDESKWHDPAAVASERCPAHKPAAKEGER